MSFPVSMIVQTQSKAFADKNFATDLNRIQQDCDDFDQNMCSTVDGLLKELEDVARDNGVVSVDELGLLFSLKTGITIGSALQAVGQSLALEEFLTNFGKNFVIKDDLVSLIDSKPNSFPNTLDTIPENITVHKMRLRIAVETKLPYTNRTEFLDLTVNSSDRVRATKDRIAEQAMIPFSNCDLKFQGNILKDCQTLGSCGVAESNCLQFVCRASEDVVADQIAEVIKASSNVSLDELEILFSVRYGRNASATVQSLGWGETLQHFLQRHSRFCLSRTVLKLAGGGVPSNPAQTYHGNQKYIDLHTSITDHHLQSQLLNLSRSLSCILDGMRIVPSGSVAKDIALKGDDQGAIAIFIRALTEENTESTIATMAERLTENLPDLPGVFEVIISDRSLKLRMVGPLKDVFVHVLPDHGGFANVIKALRNQSSHNGTFQDLFLSAQSVRFVQRQPEGVKATMRLMKWWRNQRKWSSELTRPNDVLIELVVAHALSQHIPSDLADAVSQVLSVMSDFDSLKVTWPLALRSYRECDIDQKMLEQRPLLHDPCNPLLNWGCRRVFQPQEVMEYARSSFF